MIAKGFQQITALSTATALTVPAKSRFVLLQCEGANVRFRDDGTAPTATVGMLLTAGAAPWLYEGDNLSALKLIQVAAGATLNAAFYGE